MTDWRNATGHPPRTKAEKVFVRYRNGLESKEAYPTRGQRWSDLGQPWDIVAYRIPEEEAEDRAA